MAQSFQKDFLVYEYGIITSNERPSRLSCERRMLEGCKKYQNDPFNSLFNNMSRDLVCISDLLSFGHWKFYGMGYQMDTSFHIMFPM